MKRSAKLTYSTPAEGIRDLAGISNQIVRELPFNAPLTITASADIDGTYRVIYVDTSGGDVTITPPNASAIEGSFSISKISADANIVTFDPKGAETVNGAASVFWFAQYDSYTFVSNGTGWSIA